MRKPIILLVFLSVSSLNLFAQKIVPIPTVAVPVDSITKLITYEGVISTPGTKADVIYKRAVDWFNTFYKNPTEVIRENDSLKFRIVGKPRFRISNAPDKDGFKTEAGLVQYTITVGVREGRFKYELTDFNWKQVSYFASEKWMDVKSPVYLPVYADYLKQLDQYAKDLIKSLEKSMVNAKPVKDKDSW